MIVSYKRYFIVTEKLSDCIYFFIICISNYHAAVLFSKVLLRMLKIVPQIDRQVTLDFPNMATGRVFPVPVEETWLPSPRFPSALGSIILIAEGLKRAEEKEDITSKQDT